MAFVTRKTTVHSAAVSNLLDEASRKPNNTAALSELRSISREKDPDIFYSSLLNFGFRQEDAGNEALAVQAYRAIQAETREGGKAPLEVVKRASSRLSALTGQGGSVGDQVEVSFHHFQKELPTMLLTMTPGWLGFKTMRLIAGNGFMRRPVANALTRGFVPWLASTLAGIGVEGPILTALQHGLGQGTSSWGKDLLTNYKVMLGMRGVGEVAMRFSRMLGLAPGIGQSLVHQASTLGGMSLTQDLSPTQMLMNLGYFHLSGALTYGILGKHVGRWEQALEPSARRSAVSGPPAWRGETGMTLPRLAYAAVGSAEPVAKPLRSEPHREALDLGRVYAKRPKDSSDTGAGPPNMIRIPEGKFRMGGPPKWALTPTFKEPIFKDPASAITQKSLIREYHKEGPLIVAQEDKNVLIAVPQRKKIQLRNGPATPVYYFLNSGFIGGRILQLNAQSKEWGVAGAELVVSTVQAVLDMGLQEQDLSRLIALHELWQAHKLGWTYRVDVSINHNLLNAIAQPFWGGEPMFASGAVVQRKFHGETPPKVYRLPLSGPSFLEGLDSGTLSFDLGLPYQIGGHPNPRLFEKRGALEPIRVPGNPLTFPHDLLLTDFSAIANATEGAEFPIAQRHAAPIIAQLVERRSVNEPNHLFPASPQVLVFVLKEGMARGGISLLIEPESINCLAFTTFAGNGTPMLTGAADIVMEWLATQTAIQRKSLKLFNVYDWSVLAALFRQNLLDPETHVIESYAGFEKTAETVGAFGRDKLSAAYELQRSGKIKFWNVRGRPNSFLIPRELDLKD